MDGISKVVAVKCDHGLAVFASDRWGDRRPVMLSGQPVINCTFRACNVAEWANALEYAIQLIEDHQHVVKPTAESDNALNALSYLQGKLETMTEECMEQHRLVTTQMSIDKPEFMQDYLLAFSKALGQGDL